MTADQIRALPPDAIAQVVNAYRDAWEDDDNFFSPTQIRREAAAQAFRDALAAVLPQEAGAAPTIETLAKLLDEVFEKFEIVSPDDEWEASERIAEWLLPRIGAPSRAPSEAAPREVTRFEVIDHRSWADPFGRVFSAWDCRVELSYQDGGRTLKVFVDGVAPLAAEMAKLTEEERAKKLAAIHNNRMGAASRPEGEK